MQQRENKEYIKLGITLSAVAAAGILFFFLIYRFDLILGAVRTIWRILRPFVNGLIMAYLLVPLCNAFERLFGRIFGEKAGKWSKGMSILLTLLVTVTVLWLVVALIMPQLWVGLESIVTTYPEKVEALETWLEQRLAGRPEEVLAIFDENFDTASSVVQQWMETKLMPAVQAKAAEITSSMGTVLGVVKDLLLGLLISAYMLSIRKRFGAQLKLVSRSIFSPLWADRLEREVAYANKMFNDFLMGKFTDSLIIGVLCMIGVSIIGVSSRLLVSIIICFTNIIPFFGPFIGAVPCALLIMMESPLKCLYFILFIILLQTLDGNVIGPLILGDSIGLSSFWVMFAILFFGGLWGVTGMIVGVPLFAVLYDILRQLLYHRLIRKGETDLIIAYDENFEEPERAKTQSRLKRLLRKKKS